jgi:hypothetical protein
MSPWFFLALTVVFVCLAYDAHKLAVPAEDVPYALIAQGWKEDVSHVPLQEQAKRKAWNARYGFGDLRQSVWLWSILALGCAAGSVVRFLQ